MIPTVDRTPNFLLISCRIFSTERIARQSDSAMSLLLFSSQINCNIRHSISFRATWGSCICLKLILFFLVALILADPGIFVLVSVRLILSFRYTSLAEGTRIGKFINPGKPGFRAKAEMAPQVECLLRKRPKCGPYMIGFKEILDRKLHGPAVTAEHFLDSGVDGIKAADQCRARIKVREI